MTRRSLLQRITRLAAGGLAGNLPLVASARKAPRRLLLIAGTPSHPRGMHEYNAGCTLLKKCLDGVRGIETTLILNGWPKDPTVFERTDAVFLYMDGGAGHAAIQDDHLAMLAGLMNRGVGLGCAHYAVEVPADHGGKEFTDWIGGYYETGYSCNPVWTPTFELLPRHPVTRGVKPFTLEDEWYMTIRFRPDVRKITPILAAKPSDAVRKGPYAAPPGPYSHVVAASGQAETLMWVTERPDGGRGFGFTGAHYHKNWGNDDFRKVVLNALVWIAGGDIPKNGIASTFTPTDLTTGLDDKP